MVNRDDNIQERNYKYEELKCITIDYEGLTEHYRELSKAQEMAKEAYDKYVNQFIGTNLGDALTLALFINKNEDIPDVIRGDIQELCIILEHLYEMFCEYDTTM